MWRVSIILTKHVSGGGKTDIRNTSPKYLNATNVIGLRVAINGTPVDLATWDVKDFKRELDMQRGVLTRTFTLVNGTEETNVEVVRFFSIVDKEVLAIRYKRDADQLRSDDRVHTLFRMETS